MVDEPFVSVVMPSYNQRQFIEQSIESVLGQEYGHLELIVADGASTDGTVDLLHEISQKEKRLKWLSKPDTGPAEAINRALDLTSGTLIGWLNSDDLYTHGAIERAVEALSTHREWIMVYGQGEHVDDKGEYINTYPTLDPSAGLSSFADSCYICQPTVFFKKTMVTLLGGLDTSFKASFDFEYWLRAFSSFPERIGFIDCVQAQSRLHRDCITVNNRRTVAIEGVKIISKYLGTSPVHWISTYIEEYLSLPEEARDDESLQVHVLTLLDEIENCLAPNDVKMIKKNLMQYSQ